MGNYCALVNVWHILPNALCPVFNGSYKLITQKLSKAKSARPFHKQRMLHSRNVQSVDSLTFMDKSKDFWAKCTVDGQKVPDVHRRLICQKVSMSRNLS